MSAEAEAEALLEFASICHLTTPTAVSALNEVVSTVEGWRSRAVERGIRRAEITEVGAVIDEQLARLRKAIRPGS